MGKCINECDLVQMLDQSTPTILGVALDASDVEMAPENTNEDVVVDAVLFWEKILAGIALSNTLQRAYFSEGTTTLSIY